MTNQNSSNCNLHKSSMGQISQQTSYPFLDDFFTTIPTLLTLLEIETQKKE